MLNYNHFIKMTDHNGMLQFSVKGVPDAQSGYTLDDNARALMVALLMGERGYPYAVNFVNYMQKAQRPDGRWFNFYLEGKYYSSFDSEDSLGRAFLACSLTNHFPWPDLEACCTRMLQRVLPRIPFLSSPRSIAYVLLALCKGNVPGLPSDQLSHLVHRLSQQLLNLYQLRKCKDWLWFEDYLTYCNAVIPHALFSVYSFNRDQKCLRVATNSLGFLNGILFRTGYLNIVGNQGWYIKGGTLPIFDQQPVDAASIALACQEAYRAVGKKEYLHLASLAQEWYYGNNIHQLPLYDPATGGCYDALTEKGVNLNQGAEAVLSVLLTDLLLSKEQNQVIKRVKTS